MSGTFTAALCQTTSGGDVNANADMIEERFKEAVSFGADFVMFPEAVNLMELGGGNLAAKTYPLGEDPSLVRFQGLAGNAGKWLLIGSMAVAHERRERKFSNRSVLISAAGDVVATYDKIHMFDVDLDGGESYRESKNYHPGGEARVAQTPWGGVGMTICYDIRFPHLYRRLAQAGASMLTAPAAFTRPTGEAHWHVLLRARAIENGCFVFAPAQCGQHEDGRKTYGHSLIVDPWGAVLADGGEEPGVVLAEIDLSLVDKARRRVPSLRHDRPIDFAQASV